MDNLSSKGIELILTLALNAIAFFKGKNEGLGET